MFEIQASFHSNGLACLLGPNRLLPSSPKLNLRVDPRCHLTMKRNNCSGLEDRDEWEFGFRHEKWGNCVPHSEATYFAVNLRLVPGQNDASHTVTHPRSTESATDLHSKKTYVPVALCLFRGRSDGDSPSLSKPLEVEVAALSP